MLFQLPRLTPVSERVLADTEVLRCFGDAEVVIKFGHRLLGQLLDSIAKPRVYQTLPGHVLGTQNSSMPWHQGIEVGVNCFAASKIAVNFLFYEFSGLFCEIRIDADPNHP